MFTFSTAGINLTPVPQPTTQDSSVPPQAQGTSGFTTENIGPETGARPKYSSPTNTNSNSASKANKTGMD